jgi:hypothetical protein
MSGRRRADADVGGAFQEIFGILLCVIGFCGASFTLYKIGGLWVALIPLFLLLIWVGYGMATRIPPPGGNTAGTASGTQPVPKYVDPDADLPVNAFHRDRERD